MKKTILFFTVLTGLIACQNKDSKKLFKVSGTLKNTPAKMIYLEEIPMTNPMQRAVVDSATIGKDGKYELQTETKYAQVYNLRVDQNEYPLASVINDVSHLTLNASFSKENSLYAETYDVMGSPVSIRMKDFITNFNAKLQGIYMDAQHKDSLNGKPGTDSTMAALENHARKLGEEAKALSMDAINKAENPALAMFELGYYQSIANNPGFLMKPLTTPEVSEIVNKIWEKNGNHPGIVSIKNSLDQQVQKEQGWIGKQVPNLELPDVNGKNISLSSFRGKYVLVDFWASWCSPCRQENPTVVQAFKKFKDKNFTILGVSLDKPDGKSDWVKAIMQDNLTWTHVSDLKHWESPVVSMFQIESIPFNLLVDPEGKVIAQGLHGSELDKKLSEVLK